MTLWSDWAHVMMSAFGRWIPGDERGFRDRRHRIHSGGDYRNPPPPEEHAGLRRHVRATMGEPVTFAPELRAILAASLGEKFEMMRTPARIIAVTPTHAHALVRVGSRNARPLVGRAKQFASHRVRATLPGHIWGESCGVVRIRDESHYHQAVRYIKDHRAEGGAVWVHPSVCPPE